MSKRNWMCGGAALSAGLAVAAAARPAIAAGSLTCVPYKASDIYALGETVGWKISPAAGDKGGTYHYSVKKNDLDEIKAGTIDTTTGGASIELTLNEPAMLYVQLTPETGAKAGGGPDRAGTHDVILGAAVDPQNLQPSAPRPADFDDFWAGKIKELEKVPANPVITPGDSGSPSIDYGTLRMDHVNGTHVYGHVAKPKGEGKHPALVIFQWASPPYPLERNWVTDRASEGWLAVNIEPHDVLPNGPKSYYEGLPAALKNYQSIGQTDRDKNYFLQMYLADYRAVEYVASRPDWDGKTLAVMGTSMGGQQSLCVAGLNKRITALIVNEPAGCDLNGRLHGRATGYPFWPSNDEKVMAVAPYFDAVNFASHIEAKSMVAMGFVDTIAPPVGVWTAFNQIRGPKEAVPMPESSHNNTATAEQQKPYTVRSTAWLQRLVTTGDVEPIAAATGATGAIEGIERTDPLSRAAHQQLLAKVKQGRIDVYFEGDSITRRWGTSDPQYADFLQNWRNNFSGWNAADFGWGGDTVQNVLWRVQHGELEGAHPKIVVLMAGTNNLGMPIHAGMEDAKVSEVVDGIHAIVQKVQTDLPTATVVVMGITPREDRPNLMPVIARINDRLSQFADGKQIFFLNINNQMLNSDGHLLEGMVNADHLHLAVKGYQLWADALRPLFEKTLGPQASTDAAPAPTAQPTLNNQATINQSTAATSAR